LTGRSKWIAELLDGEQELGRALMLLAGGRNFLAGARIGINDNGMAARAARWTRLTDWMGGSQTDIAELTAEDIVWNDRTISYRRNKTDVPVIITFGAEVALLLQALPKSDPLFPRIIWLKENHRAKMFIKRLRTVGSYRDAWAERAKTAGMPERFAQQALGHS
jgi:hypothetical protein